MNKLKAASNIKKVVSFAQRRNSLIQRSRRSLSLTGSIDEAKFILDEGTMLKASAKPVMAHSGNVFTFMHKFKAMRVSTSGSQINLEIIKPLSKKQISSIRRSMVGKNMINVKLMDKTGNKLATDSFDQFFKFFHGDIIKKRAKR